MFRHVARRGRIVAFGVLLLATGLPTLAQASTPRAVVAAGRALPVGDRVVTRVIDTSFDVVLNQSHPRELASFLRAITDPSSADYRHFLTPRQFAGRFGASRAAVATVRDYLAGYGLRVGALSRGRVVLSVRGSTTQIAAAFAARVVTVRTASGDLRAQFLARATLPAQVARDVHGVTGLTSVTPPSPALSSRGAHLGASVTLPGTCPQAGSSSGTTPNSLGGYTISQQAQLYGFNTQWAQGNTGAGQTIGIYELEPYATADINTYFKCYGISPSVTNVLVDGGSTDPNGLEATLDVEEAAALAPGAAIQVYTGPNADTGPTDVLTHMADDNTASIISTSWGICETNPTNDPTAEQPIFEQMAAQGQTFVAAAGDFGSSDCADPTDTSTFAPGVDDPASQPFVTGVGGLTVSNINPLTQTVWNMGLGYIGAGAGGGGISKLWSRPSWQNAPGISASQTMRLVPDLSVMADPSTGFIAYFTGSETGVCSSNCYSPWANIGGTSIGSPLVSAMTAVAAQGCAAGRLGFINPALYAMDRANKGFIDVTTGNNDLLNTGVYSAGVGFDEASGLGSPDPSTFYAGLCPATLSTSASSLSAAKPSAPVGSSLDVTLLARDAASNPIANALVHVAASASKGALVLDGDATTASGPGAAGEDVTTDAGGSAVVAVSTDTAGPVTVTATYAGTTLSTTITFSAVVVKAPPGRAGIAKLTAKPGGFTLVASPPASAGSSPITGYQYSLNAGGSWSRFPGASRTVTVSRLAKGKKYTVVVRALNAVGPGPASAAKSVTTKR